MIRKRTWEIGSALALAALLALAAAGYGRYQQLDRALARAIDAHDAEGIRILVAQGANPRTRGRETRFSVLHVAAFRRDLPLATLLIARNADVNARKPSGRTPLMDAATFAPEIAALLLEHGADPNIVDAHGQSALTCAVSQNEPELAAALIRAGAKVSVPDNRGNTPLALARILRHKLVVRVLEEHGAKN